MVNPKVTGNKEFFNTHKSLYMRVLDGRCPICNSTITNLDLQNANAFSKSGLCIMCGKHYGNNLGRALRNFDYEIWRNKCSEHADRRNAGTDSVSGKKLPFLLGKSGGRIYDPRIEPSYVIENHDISRPPRPKYTPNSVSSDKVRKYLAEKHRGEES